MKKLSVVLSTVLVLLAVCVTGAFAHELTKAQEVVTRIMGAADFANIVWVFSIGLATVCILTLLQEWLVYLVTLLPAEVYEVLCYLVSIGFIVDAFANTITTSENAPFIALTGCVLVGVSLLFGCYIHSISMKPATYFGILLPVFGNTAMVFGSSLIGFGAVLCLMAVMGFSVWIGPLCYGFGFEKEDGLIRASLVSFILVTLVVATRITNISVPSTLGVFELGALWMGTLVGYLGLLIASFTYYRGNHRVPTAVMKVAMILFCLGGMFIGSIWGIGVLKVIAVVYFTMFILELPLELRPKNVTAWACTGLFIAAVGWGGSLWVKSHMDIVGHWLTF